jgi:hypothetical protein
MQLYIFHPLRSNDDTKVPAHLEQKQSHEDLQRRDERQVSVGVYVLISKQTFRPEREHPAVNGGGLQVRVTELTLDTPRPLAFRVARLLLTNLDPHCRSYFSTEEGHASRLNSGASDLHTEQLLFLWV